MVKSYAGGISLPAAYGPEQIESMYRDLALPKETICAVHQYFEAASHLYGIIPLKHLLHIYNSQNLPISQEDFLAVAEIIRHEANDFCILEMDDLYEDAPATVPLDREIISLLVLSFGLDKYYEQADLQTGKAYTILPKEEFLAYLNSRFYPATPENLNMLAFLKSCLAGSRSSARDTLCTIQTMIWMGSGVQDAIRCLSASGFRFQNHAEKRKFTVLFHAMERHTRTIAGRGQTLAATGKHRSLFYTAYWRLFSGIKSVAGISGVR